MAQVSLPHTLVAGALENVAHVQNNFTTLRDHINTALIGDDNLTSPNNSVWRPVFSVAGSYANDTKAAGTYMLIPAGLVIPVTTVAHKTVPIWHPVAADLAVAGKTTQVRVRADVAVNIVAPGVSFTIGLYPIASVGGGGDILLTPGAVIATALFTTPAASAAARTEGSLVTLPAAASYVLAVVLSGTPAAGSYITITATLDMRHS